MSRAPLIHNVFCTTPKQPGRLFNHYRNLGYATDLDLSQVGQLVTCRLTIQLNVTGAKNSP
jgi:hypothetical protein